MPYLPVFVGVMKNSAFDGIRFLMSPSVASVRDFS